MSRYLALPLVAAMALIAMTLVACGGGGGNPTPSTVTLDEVLSAAYTANTDAEGIAAYELAEDYLGLEADPLYNRMLTETPMRSYFGELIAASNNNPSQNPTFGQAITAAGETFGVTLDPQTVLDQLNEDAERAYFDPSIPNRNFLLLISRRSAPTRDETNESSGHTRIEISTTVPGLTMYALVHWVERTQTFNAPPPPPPNPAPTNPCMFACADRRAADYAERKRVVKTKKSVQEIYARLGQHVTLQSRAEFETRTEQFFGRTAQEIEQDYRDCIRPCHQQ